jgi:hypothetical protein
MEAIALSLAPLSSVKAMMALSLRSMSDPAGKHMPDLLDARHWLLARSLGNALLVGGGIESIGVGRT